MEIDFDRQALNEALQSVIGVVAKRHPRQDIINILIQPKEGAMFEAIGTNLEVSVRQSFNSGSMINDGESILVNGHDFASIIKTLDGESVKISTSDDQDKIVIKSGKSRFRLNLPENKPEDFPDVPSGFDEKSKPVRITTHALMKLIIHAGFCPATEVSRYAINGVFFRWSGRTIEMASTDGRRLAHCEFTFEKPLESSSEFIIPPKMLVEMAKRLESCDPEQIVQVAEEKNQLVAVIGDTVLSGRLIDGNYPKFRDVIPKEDEKGRVKFTLNRRELSAKLRQAQLVTSEHSLSVTLVFGEGKVRIEAQTPERGDAVIEMDVETPEACSIAVNPQYLEDICKVATEDEITLDLAHGAKPAVIREGGVHTYVIMPITTR